MYMHRRLKDIHSMLDSTLHTRENNTLGEKYLILVKDITIGG